MKEMCTITCKDSVRYIIDAEGQREVASGNSQFPFDSRKKVTGRLIEFRRVFFPSPRFAVVMLEFQNAYARNITWHNCKYVITQPRYPLAECICLTVRWHHYDSTHAYHSEKPGVR